MSETYSIQVQNVSKIFTTQKKGRIEGFMALQNVSLQIRKGEFISLVGPSGCGKSTVLNHAAGLSLPSEGRILVNGQQVKALSVGIGYVTQEDNLFPWRTMIDNVTYGLELRGMNAKQRREKVAPLIEKVGLKGFEGHYPHQLSGGMRKRASIIRTLVLDPEIILMDEPFGPLDAQTRTLLQQELLDLWEGTGKTVVFVTHDLIESIALSDRVAVFTKAPGRIKSIYDIPFPRPRDVFNIHHIDGFNDLHDQIWSDIRGELAETKQEA
ncbi:ABC transporter ATP-binding protein [Xylanibacillus composti]|uniref:Mannosyltransferase n=1 Tax=Xylanibacillus composti TaxID=1572762 RepID=A0A8J4H2W9_9BACL|nr:ABC transporter ATP-binding protein [Xylanibacillus composti]MDT9726472.1 ABC transporter ATP-binding protein [Xylanibacillus composti]GIQ69958.1 mannosyltransferase [Xylanibacillus composti]